MAWGDAMRSLVALTAAAALLAACSDEAGTHRVLSAAGYREIQVDGYAPWGCADDDTFQTAFRARGPTGKPVQGVVCAGWLKGSTVRLE